MDWRYFFISIFFVSVSADIGHVLTLNVLQDERIRFECTLTSKTDAEEAMWMRIRPPHNPDILTYRDTVVYDPDRIELEQRRLSSSTNTNGTFIDTYFLTLTILRSTIKDEGRYICSKGRKVFAEYDLFIIIPPQFVDNKNILQQQTVIEGSTLHLSCSAYGRPMPFITWFYQTNNDKHVLLGDGKGCRDTICELHFGNYTRHDPTVIECIADNDKSTRISKVFHIDVFYPPRITTKVGRKLKVLKNLDISLECSSISNPPASITWLDDNRVEIDNHQLYSINITNQSSILSFIVSPYEHSKVLYYCRSNNSIGTVEKLINISNLIQYHSKPKLMRNSTKKPIIVKSTRLQSTLETTTIISTNSSISSCYSNILLFIFIICNFLKNIIDCTV